MIVPVADIPVAGPTPRGDLMSLYKFSQRMRVACREASGKGLSAVQVGMPWDLFVVADLPRHLRHGDDPWGTFVGCRYVPVGDSMHESVEGCLSLRDAEGRLRFYRLNRHAKVRVLGHRLLDVPDLSLAEVDHILDVRNDAIVFQHEIDHESGILISDAGEEVLLWR